MTTSTQIPKMLAERRGRIGTDPYRPWRNTGAELTGFLGAEILAEGVWIGAAAITGMIPKSMMHAAASAVGKVCIEPFLDPIEKTLGKVCKLKECQPDPSLPKSERAERLARTILVYAPAIAISLEAKVATRKFFNKRMALRADTPTRMLPENASMWQKITHYGKLRHWSPQEKMIFFVDEGTQIGSFLVLNNQLAPFTDDMVKSTSGVLQHAFHMKKEKADEWGAATWLWVVPNSMGAIGAAAMIAGRHLADWPKGWVGRVLGRKGPESPSR